MPGTGGPDEVAERLDPPVRRRRGLEQRALHARPAERAGGPARRDGRGLGGLPPDSAFGAGPAKITAQVTRPSDDSDYGTVDDTPDVTFTLDLAKAAFTAG